MLAKFPQLTWENPFSDMGFSNRHPKVSQNITELTEIQCSTHAAGKAGATSQLLQRSSSQPEPSSWRAPIAVLWYQNQGEQKSPGQVPLVLLLSVGFTILINSSNILSLINVF